MSDVNKTMILGNIGKDPEIKYFSNGNAVASFSVAVNRNFKRGEEWDKETTWFNVSVFGKLAENVAERIGKGDRVYVEGRMTSRKYEDKSTGKQLTAWDLVAERVSVQGRSAGTSNGGSAGEQLSSPDDLPFE